MKQKGGLGNTVFKRPLDIFLNNYISGVSELSDKTLQNAQDLWISMWEKEKEKDDINPKKMLDEIYNLVIDNIYNYDTIDEILDAFK